MKVFVSHSRQNGSAALKLSDQLRQRGIDTWLDLNQLDSGADWNSRVTEAIHSADGFLFLIGPGEPDQFQRFEWHKVTDGEYYLDANRPLVPIVIGEADLLPGFLRTRRALHADPSAMDFAALTDQVAKALGAPGDTIDPDNLARGQEARRLALETLKSYSEDLGKEDVKQAGLRVLKK